MYCQYKHISMISKWLKDVESEQIEKRLPGIFWPFVLRVGFKTVGQDIQGDHVQSVSIFFNLVQSCSIPFPKAVKGGRSRICFVSQSLDPKRQPSMWKMSGSTCQALALGTEQEASQGESNKTARMPWELHHLTLQTVASSTLLGDIRGSYYRISLTSIWWLQKRRKASRECLVFFK